MSTVPRPTFGERGFVAPDESDILAGVQRDINAAFGGDLNPALETPQGQLAVTMAAIIGFCNDTILSVINQVDPAFAAGRMQDAIGRLYFLERNPAQPTVVQAICSGAAGTNIFVGALARTADGTNYQCTQAGVIPFSGSITLPFACTVDGPVACPIGALTTIARTIPGWDAISNATEGVLGRNVESRAEFERRRQASVELNAVGTLPAIRAAVLNVPDVLDVYATENATGSTITVGTVNIAARSLFVSVAGGEAAAVAREIWKKKAPGCGYVGNTTVNVPDDQSGYSPPVPTYAVTFTTPTPVPIFFAVEIADSPAVPADVADQIKAAIVRAFAGVDGGSRARIGATLYASRFYAPVASLGSWVQIVSIKLGGAAPATADDIYIEINKVPTISDGDITVTVS